MNRWLSPLGFKIRQQNEQSVSIVTPKSDDGAIERVVSGAGFSAWNYTFDFQPKNEVELINKYRQISLTPELDSAIEDIVNEAIVVEQFDEEIVRLNIAVEKNEVPPQVQELIIDEFKNVLTLLDFTHQGHDKFRQWYIDGRIYFHLIVNEANLGYGIREIRYVDPRKIKKVREITKETNAGVDVVTGVDEYFVFNDRGVMDGNGVRLSPDTIVYVPSGLLDENNQVISYLHKAIKPLNMLRLMEDSMLIYQMTRAPERRVFYVDVSGMSKTKSEQYLKNTMDRYKNKIVYNSATGEIRDDRHFMSMLEDFWMPRQSNGRATEITTLQSTQITGQADALNTYKDKLARSLNIPMSRFMSDTPFNIGRSMEITRDEVKFSKFISKLRSKFCDVFSQALRVQLILKGIIAPEDWDFIKSKLQYEFIQDNNFAELRDNEILGQRIAMLEQVEPLVGKYVSEEYVRKKILRQTDEEIQEENKRIELEREEKLALMQKYPQLYDQSGAGPQGA